MLHLTTASDVAALTINEFCAATPLQATLLGEFAQSLPAAPHLAQYFLCVLEDDELVGLCWLGGNIVPFGIPSRAIGIVAEYIRSTNRRFSSVVGPRSQVIPLWEAIKGDMPKPRSMRLNQPLMVMNQEPAIEADPRVQRSTIEQFSKLYPACVAMFTEEVGYAPDANGAGYEVRVAQLIRQGRSFSRIDGDTVVFKAEVGVIAHGVAQVQGVWVNPTRRGEGIAARAMAAVVKQTLQHLAPTVSLYVNDFNTPALRTYARVGFKQVDTYATILL